MVKLYGFTVFHLTSITIPPIIIIAEKSFLTAFAFNLSSKKPPIIPPIIAGNKYGKSSEILKALFSKYLPADTSDIGKIQSNAEANASFGLFSGYRYARVYTIMIPPPLPSKPLIIPEKTEQTNKITIFFIILL